MKIFLDISHGGTDPGAVSIVKESQYALSYGLELGHVLKELGFEVMYSRTTDVFVSLSERCNMANVWGADYFISIHFNAGGGIGIETFALSAGGKGEWLASAVQTALITSTGSRDRGIKFANFQVLRNTKMPAILIEGGFVDNPIDAKNIQTEDYKRKFIQGATKGICAYTGVVWKDTYALVVAPVIALPTPSPDITDPNVNFLVWVRTSKAKQAKEQINALGYACEQFPIEIRKE